MKCWRQLLGKNLWVVPKFFSGFSRFKAGRTSTDDDERSGRPVSSSTPEMIQRMRQIIREDRRRNIYEVSMLVGISHGTCHKILTEDLKMDMSHQSSCPDSWVSTKNSNDLTFAWTSKKMPLMTLAFFRMSLQVMKHGFTPTTRKPKLNPVNGKVRVTLMKKARQLRSNIKSMLICFFDQKEIVHREFVPPGQTVNAAFYVEVLKRLRENVRRKWPDQWRNNTWLLHHDIGPAHAALLTRWFWTDNNVTVVPHPPYSLNLAPTDFFLFPKLKMKLKGRRFQTMEEIKAESQAVLNTLRENDFQECFNNWQRRWDRCQASEGDNFESDAGR